MIARDPRGAAGTAYDLIVVGGGVYGIALTLEAARRGLRPLLLERRDFGGATSWNSLRIVHGGLRYLQGLDVRRYSESVAERRWWLRHFPDQVRPLACLMPLYGEGLRRPSVFRLALSIDDLLSRHRNQGLREDRALQRGRVLSPREALEACPLLEDRRLLGAALWHDAAMPDSQRLLIEMLHWATAAGGVALNYVAARRLLQRAGKVDGVEGVDVVTGEALEFQGQVVVNCAGPWCREVAAAFDRDLPELFHLSLAFNAVLDREPPAAAALAVGPRGRAPRTYFLVPWKGRVLAGTHHTRWTGSRQEGAVTDRLVHHLLDDLNAALPGLELRPPEVLGVHWGFLPAQRAGSEKLARREVIRHHGDLGGPTGLFSLSGVKFTTARRVAERALRHVQRRRGGRLPPAGGPPRPAARSPVSAEEFATLAERDEGAARDILRSLLTEESVVRPADLLLRRTDWGVGPRWRETIPAAVGRLLDWDDSIVESELGAWNHAVGASRAE